MTIDFNELPALIELVHGVRFIEECDIRLGFQKDHKVIERKELVLEFLELLDGVWERGEYELLLRRRVAEDNSPYEFKLRVDGHLLPA